jgi:hypothetical protein
MAKSQKSIVKNRINDVLRLMTVGAEFADIKGYAREHNWQIGDRQVRRYIKLAFKRFAKATEQDRKSLVGRHLLQRRAIYARAIKTGDLRAALHALKDEATLQGLYPDPKGPLHGLENVGGIDPNAPKIERRVRVARSIMAQATGDKDSLALLDGSTPKYWYHMPDTLLPQILLSTLASNYVVQQLDCAGMVLHAIVSLHGDEPDTKFCAQVLAVYSYIFKTRRDGWELFCGEIGIDPHYLVNENYDGLLLQMAAERIASFAMTAEELVETLKELGANEGGETEATVSSIVTADDLAKAWRGLYRRITREM